MIENTNSRRYEKMTDDDDEIIVVPTNLTKEEDTFSCVRNDDFSFQSFFFFSTLETKNLLHLGSFSRNDNNKKRT